MRGSTIPVRRARRMVDFDKAADAFDLSAFSSLAAIAVPAGEALPRLERVASNWYRTCWR